MTPTGNQSPTWGGLEPRTWMQLRECTFLGLRSLEYAALSGDENARSALEAMRYVLSDQWDGEHRETLESYPARRMASAPETPGED